MEKISCIWVSARRVPQAQEVIVKKWSEQIRVTAETKKYRKFI